METRKLDPRTKALLEKHDIARAEAKKAVENLKAIRLELLKQPVALEHLANIGDMVCW